MQGVRGLAQGITPQQALKQGPFDIAQAVDRVRRGADLMVERAQPAQVFAQHVDHLAGRFGRHDQVRAGQCGQHGVLSGPLISHLARVGRPRPGRLEGPHDPEPAGRQVSASLLQRTGGGVFDHDEEAGRTSLPGGERGGVTAVRGAKLGGGRGHQGGYGALGDPELSGDPGVGEASTD